jgi:excinuclease ABC subunit C
VSTNINQTLVKVREVVRSLPSDPGIYMMKNKDGQIIYIGKAKNLRKRVSSYFANSHDKFGWKTSRLVRKIENIEFIITDNEVEAFLLESNLIKQYRPLFNIDLKDQQRYTYLKISNEPFPRLLVARRNREGKFTGPKGQVFGPFVQGSSKLLTIGHLRKLFKIRICNRLPKKPCLEYFINNCDAPCIGNVSEDEYMMNIESLKEILNKKNGIDKFMNEMRQEMESASEKLEYEKAKEIRNTLLRLENLRTKQKIENSISSGSEEYVGIQYDLLRSKAHILILSRYRGVIKDTKKFEFDMIGDNSLSTFLSQYYSSKPVIPRMIYVNEEPDSRKSLEILFEQLSTHKVSIMNISNFSDRRKQLMTLILRNLSAYLEKGFEPALYELKKILGLKAIPKTIDCFDISNLATSIAVGSCVRFINGIPDKSYYRRFRIKNLINQNDFAMIEEVVTRRYSSISNYDLPHLVVIDGGKGQLSSALKALHNLKLDISCISIAKENEEIYLPHKSTPIGIDKSNQALKILQQLRDEAHRFSLAYNIKLRDAL